MKVYIVWYINSSYNDYIQAVFLSRKAAQKYMKHQRDPVNFYIEEWEVDG